MAQKYRKVDPRIWTDEGFSKLDAEGKLLALWMLTSARVNRCGIVLWSAALASEETGIHRDHIDAVCDTVCDTVSWARDIPSRVVFLSRWWRYNRPDNEKALKGALADLWDVPRNNLKPALICAKADLPTPYQAAYERVLDTVYDTVSPQEQEQEQEQEPISATTKPVAEKVKKSKPEKAKKTREPNPLFDAIAEVTGSAPKASGSLIGKVAAALASEEPPFTPEEVRAFGARFHELCSWAARDNRAMPNLVELQNHIGKIRAASAVRPASTFQSPPDFDRQPPREDAP
jgi:hypothetical protein